MYLGCLTDDEQSRARANVPTDLATIKNLSMSASERSFRDLQLPSSLSASPLFGSSFDFWPGGIQSLSSMSGNTSPGRVRSDKVIIITVLMPLLKKKRSFSRKKSHIWKVY
jgi:hypothetical protein